MKTHSKLNNGDFFLLYLKPANFEDLDAEYEYVKEMPIDENGLTNEYFGISKEDFEI